MQAGSLSMPHMCQIGLLPGAAIQMGAARLTQANLGTHALLRLGFHPQSSKVLGLQLPLGTRLHRFSACSAAERAHMSGRCLASHPHLEIALQLLCWAELLPGLVNIAAWT